MMKGDYSWRPKLLAHVLGGVSSRLIQPKRLSVAQFLKDRGYHTAVQAKGTWRRLSKVKGAGRRTVKN